MKSRLFGLRTEDLRKLSYQLAENYLRYGFKREDKAAGSDLLKVFRSRHLELSLTKPVPKSVAWAVGFKNNAKISQFVNLLYEQIDKHKYN